jgi:hypothetical protein
MVSQPPAPRPIADERASGSQREWWNLAAQRGHDTFQANFKHLKDF